MLTPSTRASTSDSTLRGAPETALARAVAQLDDAVEQAQAHAQCDPDELMSPWADTVRDLNLAAAALRQHLPGPVDPVEPGQYRDCVDAVQAAAGSLGQVRADLDAPLRDLAYATAQLGQALRHVLAQRPQPADGSPDPASGRP